ncbi:MAG: hypothetical protein D4R64_07780 [Porphyromonadaceae bacterium]|nr:MAG: hypothetical protein D4R64_07780 [Porphyromonadaceae bacterium]
MERKKIAAGIILLFLLSIVQANVKAQDLIFEKWLDHSPDHPNFGPNRRHFYHAFLSTSLTIPTSGTLTINTDQPFTGQITVGFRYKLKVTKPFAIVSECGINRNFFRINQSPGRNFPDTLIHQSQSIITSGLFSGIFLRVRLGQRGDYLSKYIDLGITAQASIINHLVTKDVFNSAGPKPYLIEKTTVSGLKNINTLTYKAYVRFGFDRFSLIASYRLSRLVNTSSLKDLPDLEIGFEISPVRY